MTRARANAMLVAVVTVAVLAGLVGCGGGVAEQVAARRAEGEVERGRLSAQLEVLEARLLDGRSRLRAWADLRQRHQQVSAVACANVEWHVADMVRAHEADLVAARAIQGPRLAAFGASDPGLRTP